MDDWTPEPLEQAWLEPPRKPPRTAVGVATPPPPRGPFLRSSRSRSRMRRVAAVVGLGLLMAGTGMAAGIALPLNALLEIGAGLTALELGAQLLLQRRRIARHAFARRPTQ